jgi:AcrR family transcriptional regulator
LAQSAKLVTVRKTHAERTELSDLRMFNATVQLIIEQGTERTTLKAVGERAGYSRGLAGSRFNSKPGLFCFVIRRVTDYWLEQMKASVDDKVGYAAICSAIDAHYQFCKNTPKPVRAFYILWFESIGLKNEVRDEVLGIHKLRLINVASWIERGIESGELRRGIDAEAVARHFLTVMFGIVYQWLIDPMKDSQIKLLHEQLKLTMRVLLEAKG